MCKFSWKSETILTICLMKIGKKLLPKMKIRIKKIGRMNFIFKFSITNLGYMTLFMKIWEKKIGPFFKTFFTNWSKNEGVNEKIGKISLIFEFSISKLGYVAVFMKIWEKKFDPFFKTLLTNWGKNKNEDERIWKNNSDFWVLYIKIRLCGNFHENQRKNIFDPFFKTFLTNWGKYEDKDKKIWTS